MQTGGFTTAVCSTVAARYAVPEEFGTPSKAEVAGCISSSLATGDRATLANVSAVSIRGAIVVPISCTVYGAFPLVKAVKAIA